MRVIMQCTDFKSVKIVVRRGRRSQCPGIMLGSSNYQQLIPDNTNKSQSRISNLCHTTRLFIQQLSLHSAVHTVHMPCRNFAEIVLVTKLIVW